jgi:DNA-binding phage protein
MTQNEITKIAKEVGFSDEEIDKCQLMFERFAKLVAQHEREACAKWLEDVVDAPNWANVIRARGQA